MKETQLNKTEDIQIVDQVQAKKKRELVGTIHPHTGHICFEFNRDTKELKKATFKDAAFRLTNNKNTPPVIRKVVVINENCYYVSSLNAKNAAKKIHKQLGVAYVIHVNE